MMRIIPDTNLMLAGMMGYKSVERRILNLCMARKIQLIGSTSTLQEFREKVAMEHMAKYWSKKYFSIDKIVEDYKNLVVMHEPTPEYRDMSIPIEDPKDAMFFQLALSSGVKIVVSRDKHLLSIDKYEGIRVLKPEKFMLTFSEIHASP